jgi:hypothetical protein
MPPKPPFSAHNMPKIPKKKCRKKTGTWCGQDGSNASILGPEHSTNPAHALYLRLLTKTKNLRSQ